MVQTKHKQLTKRISMQKNVYEILTPEFLRKNTALYQTINIKILSLMGIFSVIYLVTLFSIDGLKLIHVAICLISIFLYSFNSHTRNFFKIAGPFLLTAIIYDSMRFYTPIIRGEINVAAPYILEKMLFGILDNGILKTPNEFFANRTNPIIDLITGFAYLTFTLEYIVLTIFFYIIKKRDIAIRAAIAYLIVNLMGFITYHIYPAAPPWYVNDYGLGPAVLSALPSAAGAARFDLLLGTNFFGAMYGSSANIFGAIPSLHVSYPLLMFLFSIEAKKFILWGAFFSALMCFSAVYLNHHYILDIILGLSYALITYYIIRKLTTSKDLASSIIL